MIRRRMTCAASVIVVCLCLDGFSQVAADPQETYFYQGGKKVKVRILDQIALQLRESASVRDVEEVFVDTPGIRVDNAIERFPNEDVVIVPLRDSVTRATLAQNIRELNRNPKVRWAGRVLELENSNAPLVVTDEIVAKVKAEVAQDALHQAYMDLGVEVLRSSKHRPGRVVLRVRSDSQFDALEIANKLYESGLFEFAHPDFIIKTNKRVFRGAFIRPNDPLFERQWNLHNTGQDGGTTDADVDAPEAWDYTQGNPDVVIAVLDDGIDVGHPDLAPNLVSGGRDFASRPYDDDPRPAKTYDNHGTAVAGIAVARGNNGIGVSGSCPRCGLLPIRMIGDSISHHAEAFDYAVSQGASVITNSWGYETGTPVPDDVVDAINNAALNGRNGKGAIVLFAMTNDVIDNCAQPTPDVSSLENVIAVSASTNHDVLGKGGFGDCMEFIAPTDGGTLAITTTDRLGSQGYSDTEYYAHFDGTSAATPLVAGVVGLLLSASPDLSRTQVRKVLIDSADKIDVTAASYDGAGFSRTHGYGRISAGGAMSRLDHSNTEPIAGVSSGPRLALVAMCASVLLLGIWSLRCNRRRAGEQGNETTSD